MSRQFGYEPWLCILCLDEPAPGSRNARASGLLALVIDLPVPTAGLLLRALAYSPTGYPLKLAASRAADREATLIVCGIEVETASLGVTMG
jgi:hypothetical protein